MKFLSEFERQSRAQAARRADYENWICHDRRHGGKTNVGQGAGACQSGYLMMI
jgi:hypothetical protein